MKILLLCAGSSLAYKVLRCAASGGHEVCVLGDERSIELKSSRYCAQYLPRQYHIGEENVENIAAEINALLAAHGFSSVIPGDTESTRVLAAAQSLIQGRWFPLPNATVFDHLADKWKFKNICDDLGVPSPASFLLADTGELADALKTHGGGGWIAKPVDREGGCGFIRFEEKLLSRQIGLIDYRPILVQDFVPGQDLCISLFCQEGEPVASAIYTHNGFSIHFRHHEELERHALRIAAHFNYSGVLCFDARLDPDGKVSFIECNPRFWNHIDATMICGINFVELGLRTERPAGCLRIKDGTHFRSVIGVRKDFVRFRNVSPQDVRVLIHRLKDFSFLFRRLLGNRRR
jgi:biotin carboxylase